MKIVLAFDSFKGSITAQQACQLVADALQRMRPLWRIDSVPLADGGEGTAEILRQAGGGIWQQVQGVMGPLPRMRLTASYASLDEGRLAVVEMARASGLTLLNQAQRNPLKTTTYGTGQLLAAAIAAGAKRLILTLGGSATVDGGTGAARALGWRFFDSAGREVPLGGGALRRIARLCPPSTVLPPVEAWCDVRNPLCGVQGAARVYAPQKGADGVTVAELEAGLEHLAGLVEEQLDLRLGDVSGSGAAGGFGFGAQAFLGAQLVPGARGVMDAVGLERALAGADWLITGEGTLDRQSLQGKVVGEVARCALARGVKVAVLAGRILLDPASCRAAGLTLWQQSMEPGMTTAEALAQAAPLLAVAARRLAIRFG